MIRNRQYRFFLCALGALAAACSSAGTYAADPMSAQKSAPYVSESRVGVPRRISDFVLEKIDYDPEKRLSGALLRYRSESRPQIRLSLAVYPAGDLDERKALDSEANSFLTQFENQARAAGYAAYSASDRSGFSVKLPTLSAARGELTSVTVPINDHDTRTTDESKTQTAKITASSIEYPQKPLRGTRFTLNYRDVSTTDGTGQLVTKFVYLFNRRMHFLKATVTYLAEPASAKTSRNDADDIVRELIADIRVANIGSCGSASQYPMPKTNPTVGHLLWVAGEIGRRGCYESIVSMPNVDKTRQDEVILRYRPEDWNTP